MKNSKSIKIAIDLQGAQTESRHRGIGRYSLALAQAMARQAGSHELWICLNAALPHGDETIYKALDGLMPAERIVHYAVPTPVSMKDPENVWRARSAECVREAFFAHLQPDVTHISSLFEGWLDDAATSVGVFESAIPTAVTLYDLIPLLNADTYLKDDWMRQWYTDKIDSLKRATTLLAISEYARQETIDTLGIAPDRIVNISSAIDENFRPTHLDSQQLEDLQSRYGITRPYIMYSGAFELRKNIDRLLQAFAQLPAETRGRHDLLLVGKIDPIQHGYFGQLAKKLGIAQQVIFTNYIPDDDLIALYSHCQLFVLPSLHEGFGLPALEAMACGAATIGSNATSIPEVIGREDALFNPADTQAIAKKIHAALCDVDFNRSLRDHALTQAAKFTWDASAKRALSAFERRHQAAGGKQTWHQQQLQRQHQHRTLVQSIADIPRLQAQPDDADLRNIANSIARNNQLTDQLQRSQKLPKILTWRLEGPFDSSYSLALLNRETARALDALGHTVVLHSTEGPGDYPPNADFINANPDIAEYHRRAQTNSMAQAHITSRNLYPPRVADMDSRFNLLHHYAWEESGFPQQWVNEFNLHLQGITCLSRHVEKIMIDNGVNVPLAVSGCGVDHWQRIAPDPSFAPVASGFCFLHVSSCFPRKGADIMLQAYGQAFTADDDVALIIKTFPNPHNQIQKWLAQVQANHANYPRVVILEQDLSDSQLKALYSQCQALIAPSRAEGFGLPLAEAMLSGLAVITTDWGGQRDFCTPQTAWLIDYQYQLAQTHFNLFDSVWAEPDVKQLTQTLHEVQALTPQQRSQRTQRGCKLLLKRYRWQDVAQRLIASARAFAQQRPATQPRIGWITTWNTRCGIAAYSEHLINAMPDQITVLAAHAKDRTKADGEQVHRCWEVGDHDNLQELATQINNNKLDMLVVQFNYSLYNLEALGLFLTTQQQAGRKIVITLHSTVDPIHIHPHKQLANIRQSLANCQRILVHAVSDLNRLKTIGLIENVTLFPHGVIDYTPQPPKHSSKTSILASYGFFLPHKGLLELIEATALLRDQGLNIQLRMINAQYPVPESHELIQQAKTRIRQLGLQAIVSLQTDYLTDQQSLDCLSQADLIVFPYQHTGESSSAAVRYGLATGRPVAVTPLPIFDDVSPAVNYLPGQIPAAIAQGIKQTLQHIADNHIEAAKKQQQAEQWRDAHRYASLSARLSNILMALHRY